jgi:hypothetical protein
MVELHQPTNRRTLLHRGLIFLAGAAGLQLADKEVRAGTGPAPEEGSKTLRFCARRWQAHSQGQRPGQLPARQGRTNTHGELLDAATGKKVGEFYATSFCPEASFGGQANIGAAIELQTFTFSDGILFGMGSAASGAAGPQHHAILGGTGRFAGARGICVVSPGSRTGEETVELVINSLS